MAEGKPWDPRTCALSDELWLGLVAVTRAAFGQNFAGLHDAVRQHPILSDRSQKPVPAEALQVMAFLAIARRIRHRPIVDADATQVARELMPKISAYTLVTLDEVVDAVRSALYLPISKQFHNRRAANRIGGIWISIIGARVDDFTEVLDMKPEVQRVLAAST